MTLRLSDERSTIKADPKVSDISDNKELANTLTAAIRAVDAPERATQTSTSTMAWLQAVGLPRKQMSRNELITAANMHHRALHRRKCTARIHRDEVVILDMSAPRPRLSPERMRLAQDLNAHERALARDVTDAAFSAMQTKLEDARLAGRLTSWESVLLAWDAADARADEAAKQLCALAYNDLSVASLEAVRARAPLDRQTQELPPLLDIASFREAASVDPREDAYSRLRRAVGVDVGGCADLRSMRVDPFDAFEVSKAGRYALNHHPDLCRATLSQLIVPYVADHLRHPENRAFWARSIVDDMHRGTHDEFMEPKRRDTPDERSRSATVAVGVAAAGVAGDWWCETERLSAGQDSRRFSAVFNVSRSVCEPALVQADHLAAAQLAPSTREAKALVSACEEYLYIFAETAALSALLEPQIHQVDEEPTVQGGRKRERPGKRERSFSGDVAPRPTTW